MPQILMTSVKYVLIVRSFEIDEMNVCVEISELKCKNLHTSSRLSRGVSPKTMHAPSLPKASE